MEEKGNMSWCSVLERLLFFAGIGHFLYGIAAALDIIPLYNNAEINTGYWYLLIILMMGIGMIACVAQKSLKTRNRHTCLIVSLYFMLDVIVLIANKVIRIKDIADIQMTAFLPILGYIVFSVINIRYLLLHREFFME